jgi:hypothetical protein
MRRRLSFLLCTALLAAPALPSSAASCASTLPVADPHAAQYDCSGVHPGMRLRVHSAKYGDISCGASFAFTDQFKQKYLTLPGTCFLDFECLEDVLEELPPPLNELLPPLVPTCTFPADSEIEPFYKKNGPAVKDADGDRIGSLVYAVNKEGINFAIARLDPGVKLDPSLPLFGGPVRLGAPGGNPEEAHVYSAPLGTYGFNARSGVLHSSTVDRAYVVTEGLLSMANGGSVMRTNGEAVGMLTGTLYTSGYGAQPFGKALARATKHTGLKLTLLTAPLT